MARTHVYLPDDLIREVDRLVGRRQRSQFFAEAAAARLAQMMRVEAIQAAAGALADIDIPGWETSESAATWVHTLRHDDGESGPSGSGA